MTVNPRNPETCPAIAEAQRQKFTVLAWDKTAKRGVVADAQHQRYNVTLRCMMTECQQILYVGEDISGVLIDWQTVNGLFPEPYSHERPQFESAGPCPDVIGWGERLGEGHSDLGLHGGKPHDGRFSHPDSHSEVKKPKDPFSGLDKLDQLLESQIEELSLKQRKLMEKTENKKEQK
jgi:hypothetical protein